MVTNGAFKYHCYHHHHHLREYLAYCKELLCFLLVFNENHVSLLLLGGSETNLKFLFNNCLVLHIHIRVLIFFSS